MFGNIVGVKKHGPPLHFLIFAFGKNPNTWRAKKNFLEDAQYGIGAPTYNPKRQF